MSTELVQHVRPEAPLAQAPSLGEAIALIGDLTLDGDSDTLDTARRQATARALYEQHNRNAEQLHHFWTLLAFTEAALGVLSFDDPTLAPRSWRTLAAAYERGVLADFCDREKYPKNLKTESLVYWIESDGYTLVAAKHLNRTGPPVPWVEARIVLREMGAPLESVPPDRAYARKRAAEQERRTKKAQATIARKKAAVAILVKQETERALARALKDKPKLSNVYTLLRKTLDALDDASAELTPMQRKYLDTAYHGLYCAEDAIGEAIRSPEQ
jgi:hypothetical protein